MSQMKYVKKVGTDHVCPLCLDPIKNGEEVFPAVNGNGFEHSDCRWQIFHEMVAKQERDESIKEEEKLFVTIQ